MSNNTYLDCIKLTLNVLQNLNAGPFWAFVVGRGVSKLATEIHLAATSYNKKKQSSEVSVHACL